MQVGNEYLSPERVIIPVAKGQVIEAGMMVAVNNKGFAVAAAKDATMTVVGVARRYEDARIAQADGEKSILVKRGAFLVNHADLAQADLFKTVYVKDATTVTKTNETSTAAGTLIAFEQGFAVVEMGGK